MTTGVTAERLISYNIIIPEWAIFLLVGIMIVTVILKVVDLFLQHRLFMLTKKHKDIQIMEKLLAKLKMENEISPDVPSGGDNE